MRLSDGVFIPFEEDQPVESEEIANGSNGQVCHKNFDTVLEDDFVDVDKKTPKMSDYPSDSNRLIPTKDGKGGLISKKISVWLKLPIKRFQITFPEHLFLWLIVLIPVGNLPP